MEVAVPSAGTVLQGGRGPAKALRRGESDMTEPWQGDQASWRDGREHSDKGILTTTSGL